MLVMSTLLMMLLCILGLEATYTFQSGDPGIVFRQQAAQVQERIINTNPDTDHSVEDTEYRENQGGAECGTGQLFYLTEEGRLMRCDTNKPSVEEQSFQPPPLPQNSPYFLLPGLPSLGLTLLVGARLPGTPLIQNQDIDGDEGIYIKKPVVIKPKPVLIKPVHKPKPIMKPVHKPLVHTHQHVTHQHCKPSIHAAVSGLAAYHQTGLASVYQQGKGQLQEEQLGLNPVDSVPYWYLIAPHRQANLPMAVDEQRVVPQYQVSNTNNPEESGSLSNEEIAFDDLKEDEGTVRSEIIGNVSSDRSLVDDDTKHIMTINLPNNSSVAFRLDLTAVNNTGDDTTEQNNVEERQSPNGNYENGKEVEEDFEATSDEVNAQTESAKESQIRSIETEGAVSDGHDEFKKHENEPRAETTEDYNVEPKTGKYEKARNEGYEQKPEVETEKSLSEGPDVMEDANGELEAAHVRKIREAPEIPIDLQNGQQRSSSSALDRNRLLNIMSSLKEQYLKNAEPDQRKSIEDAFERLHCSVRDMKKLDERPAGKKIDGSKKAALKLLAEIAQPLTEEPDYYSDAGAEPSFLELLNVATKHKGKQYIET